MAISVAATRAELFGGPAASPERGTAPRTSVTTDRTRRAPLRRSASSAGAKKASTSPTTSRTGRAAGGRSVSRPAPPRAHAGSAARASCSTHARHVSTPTSGRVASATDAMTTAPARAERGPRRRRFAHANAWESLSDAIAAASTPSTIVGRVDARGSRAAGTPRARRSARSDVQEDEREEEDRLDVARVDRLGERWPGEHHHDPSDRDAQARGGRDGGDQPDPEPDRDDQSPRQEEQRGDRREDRRRVEEREVVPGRRRERGCEVRLGSLDPPLRGLERDERVHAPRVVPRDLHERCQRRRDGHRRETGAQQPV